MVVPWLSLFHRDLAAELLGLESHVVTITPEPRIASSRIEPLCVVGNCQAKLPACSL